MRPVIKTRMVLHDISTRYVWCCGDDRAAKTFSINLFLAEHLYVGSWFQCLVCVSKHDCAPFALIQDAHDVPRIAGVVVTGSTVANIAISETLPWEKPGESVEEVHENRKGLLCVTVAEGAFLVPVCCRGGL